MNISAIAQEINSFKSVSCRILKFMMTLAPLNRLRQQGRYLKILRKIE